jgi:hypothetical protein
MRSAYLEARRFGYSRRASLRVALLVGRLSLRDPPTDLWGRPVAAGAARHDDLGGVRDT